MIAQSTAAPETGRMDVKLAPSMPVFFSAIRQRIELPANAIITRPVRAAIQTICMGLCSRYWVSVYVVKVRLNGEQLESDPILFS